MDWPNDILEDQPVRRPRVLLVLGLLALTALTFSYLAAYAVYNTLVAADVVAGFEPQNDPRPRFFFTCFCILMLIFVVIGGFFGQLSRRDMKAIDRMADAEE